VLWLNPYEDTAAKTAIHSDSTTAKSEAICYVRAGEGKVGARLWMWSMDRLQSVDGRVGAAAVCWHSDGRKAFCSQLSGEPVVVNDAEL
jgi:hypothetical protein